MLRYDYLLYSRTLTRDYRWMISPKWISSEDLLVLERLYEGYEDHKERKVLNDPENPPLFFLQLRTATVLVSCSPTDYKDSFGRKIYSLHGIAAQRKYTRHFWFVLPWMLVDLKLYLNVWKKIDFHSADDLFKFNSIEQVFDFNLLDNLPNLSAQDSIQIYTHSNQIHLLYNKNGFNELIGLVSSTEIPVWDFAFGATPEILQGFQSLKLVAPIQRRSGLESLIGGMSSLIVKSGKSNTKS